MSEAASLGRRHRYTECYASQLNPCTRSPAVTLWAMQSHLLLYPSFRWWATEYPTYKSGPVSGLCLRTCPTLRRSCRTRRHCERYARRRMAARDCGSAPVPWQINKKLVAQKPQAKKEFSFLSFWGEDPRPTVNPLRREAAVYSCNMKLRLYTVAFIRSSPSGETMAWTTFLSRRASPL